jgi:hypothetical protein
VHGGFTHALLIILLLLPWHLSQVDDFFDKLGLVGEGTYGRVYKTTKKGGCVPLAAFAVRLNWLLCFVCMMARAPTHGVSAASLRGCAHGWHLSTLTCSILVVINALAMLHVAWMECWSKLCKSWSAAAAIVPRCLSDTTVGHTRTRSHVRSLSLCACSSRWLQGPVGVLRTQVHDCHVPRAPARRSFHLNLPRDCTAARAQVRRVHGAAT